MPSCPSRRHRCDALVAAALVSSALIHRHRARLFAIRSNTEKGHDALCDTLHLQARDGHRHPRSGKRDASRGRGNDPESQGGEDARQDVGTLQRAERRLGR